MKFLTLIVLFVCGCSGPKYLDLYRPAAPTNQPARVLNTDDLRPKASQSQLAAAIAPSRTRYFAVGAFDNVGEGDFTDEVVWSVFPATLSWVWPPNPDAPGLQDISGFRIRVRYPIIQKTAVVTLGRVLSTTWPQPILPAAGFAVSWTNESAAIFFSPSIAEPLRFLTNAPGTNFVASNIGEAGFFGSSNRFLAIRPITQ